MENEEFDKIKEIIVRNFGDAPYDRLIALMHKFELAFKKKFLREF